MISFLFTDGSDLIGVTKSQDIKYMRLLKFTLKVLNAWPEKYVGEMASKYAFYGKCYTFLIEGIFIPFGVLYIKHNNGIIPFLELGNTYITVAMNTVATLRLILIFLERFAKLVGDFVTKIHLFNHKHRSECAEEIHILVHKVSHFFTMYLNIIMVCAILMFTCTPLYKNIASGAFYNYKSGNVSLEHSVYYYLPFDYQRNIIGYVVVFLFNWYISFICSSCFCTLDLLMSLMVFHVWGHLRILISSLENIGKFERKVTAGDSIVWYSEEEMQIVSCRLKEIVVHHNLVIEFTSRITSIFGPVLLLYYTFHVISGCILLLECSQMDPEALTRYGAMTFLIFQQLIQISCVFELLGIMSDNLVKAVYNVPWECMDTSNRKTIHIILIQSQRLLTVKALNMVNVGVQTMTTIIKTSFSYFIMLRTFADTY